MARRKKKPNHSSSVTSAPVGKRPDAMPVGLIVSILVTAVLAGIPFGMGKYIELNSPGPFDSGAFVYSAKHLLDGAQLGLDERSSARPGTLICNVIGVKLFGFNDTGPKIVQMIMQLAAGVFLFYTLRKIFGSVAAVIGTTLAAVYLSAPLIAKFGNVKEQFMIPFMIAAACSFCLYEFTHKRPWLIAAGFLALQPYFFKPTGMSIVFAIGLYIFVKNASQRKWGCLFKEGLLFLAGYATGLIIPALLFLWQKQPAEIFKTFPAVLIEAALVFLIFLTALGYGIPLLKQHGVQLKHIKIAKAIWLTGLLLIIATFLFSIGMIRMTDGYTEGDTASYINSIPIVSMIKAPFHWIARLFQKVLTSAGIENGYVSGSRSAIDFSQLAPKVMRYYKALGVPILAAMASIIAAGFVWFGKLIKKTTPTDMQAKIVWLLVVWWALDMAFVWVSPRSYEQYYLPLCGSAAVLSGFAVWFWSQKLKTSRVKVPWLIGGLGGVILLGLLSSPIFSGQRYSPDTGTDYTQNNGPRRRGYAQSLDRIKKQGLQPWQAAGDYIRAHSTEGDMLYVWGWVPGIYVQSQRLSPASKAFESDMHVKSPQILSNEIRGLTRELTEHPPKFIVDSRKLHVPWDRPPLELWPHTYSQKKRYGQPIPNNSAAIAQYDTLYAKLLSEKFDPQQKQYAQLPAMTSWMHTRPWTKAMPDEAKRYEAMKPLREFVMSRYKIVNRPEFGTHVVFERID